MGVAKMVVRTYDPGGHWSPLLIELGWSSGLINSQFDVDYRLIRKRKVILWVCRYEDFGFVVQLENFINAEFFLEFIFWKQQCWNIDMKFLLIQEMHACKILRPVCGCIYIFLITIRNLSEIRIDNFISNAIENTFPEF